MSKPIEQQELPAAVSTPGAEGANYHPEEADAKNGGAEPSMLRGIVRGAMAAIAVLVIAVGCLAFVVPRFIDAVPLAVLSGSMEPVYSPGDLVISKSVPPEEIAVNDVVTFQPESGNPMLITHRVIAKSLGADGIASFTTQGDANGAADEPILPEQVKGKVIYSLPYLGYVTTALDPGAKAVIAALIGAGLVGYAVFMVVSSTAGKVRRTKTHVP